MISFYREENKIVFIIMLYQDNHNALYNEKNMEYSIKQTVDDMNTNHVDVEKKS